MQFDLSQGLQQFLRLKTAEKKREGQFTFANGRNKTLGYCLRL
jgi:hypothetical protein